MHYFDEFITAGKPAGDVVIEDANAHGSPVGVDCSGFVMQVWRLGANYTPRMLQNNISRPILFQGLRAGDIIFSPDHVVIFKEWDVTYNPAQGPVAGDNGTIFKAYEASGGANKVVLSQYRLIELAPATNTGWGNYPGIPLAYSMSNAVKIRRLNSCSVNPATGQDDCRNADANTPGLIYTMGDYGVGYPRTYFTSIDVELVIDASGSMGGSNLAQAKSAAKTLVDFLRPGDKVGIVAFGNAASSVLSLTAIQGSVVQNGQPTDLESASKEYVKGYIDLIQDMGATSIGSGLQAGATELKSLNALDQAGQSDPVRVMVLLSDGQENTGPFVENGWLEDLYNNDGISIYTMQIGRAVDWQSFDFRPNELMPGIANRTQGGFSWSIDGLLELIMTRVLTGKVVRSTPGTMPESGNDQQPALVDSSMGSMTVSLFWSGNPLALTLERPDGSLLDASTPAADYHKTSFISGETYASYTIRAPQPGQWKLRISGAAGQKYTAYISAVDAMALSVDVDKKEYAAGAPIKFTAKLGDNISPSLTATAPEYVHGLIVQVTAKNPEQSPSTFALHDDGLNGDDVANDGIYGGVFDNTLIEGIYNFNVQISGVNNRAGEPFAREAHLFANVNTYPVVSSIVRASVNPTSYYTVNYTVTFSEPVVGVDISDFALTTGGIPGAMVSSVSGSGSIYTVFVVNPGNGNGTLRLDVVDDDTISDGIDPARDGANGLGGQALGGAGRGNGNFTSGETCDIESITGQVIVNKLADTDDGFCSNTDCSLREAIASAPSNAIIRFDARLSGEIIHLSSGLPFLSLSRNVTIDGSTLAAPITVSGDTDNYGVGDISVFNVNPGVTATLNDLVIAKGKLGGVSNSGILTIMNSTFTNNSGEYGGGVSNSGTLTIINSTFMNNSAAHGGGVYNKDTLIIINSTFANNIATYSGGGVFSMYRLTILNSTFSNNSSPYGGNIINYSKLNYANTILANAVRNCVNLGTIDMNVNNLVQVLVPPL